MLRQEIQVITVVLIFLDQSRDKKTLCELETNILPRNKELAIKGRYEKKLPTHNQNTTNYVDYSFRMMKDVQFNRLKAYNLTDLVDICLDKSTLYSRFITFSQTKNQDTNFKSINIDQSQIIQLPETQFMVPSENTEDKLYNVDMETGLCERLYFVIV